MGRPFLPFSEVSGDWSDQPLYIIGGGPSLKGFDFSGLMGRKLGANKSAFVADCDALFSLDQTFVRHTKHDIALFAAKGRKVVLAMPSTEDGHKPIEGATYVFRTRNSGLSEKPREIYGTNSGYGCIGLAYLLGAKEIALLGFDMDYDPKDGSTHFHSGYPWHSRGNHKYYDNWSNNFERAAQQIRAAGGSITNFVGPQGSKIPDEHIPQRPLYDLM